MLSTQTKRAAVKQTKQQAGGSSENRRANGKRVALMQSQRVPRRRLPREGIVASRLEASLLVAAKKFGIRRLYPSLVNG